MKEIISLNWNSLPFVDVPTIESLYSIPNSIQCCIYFVCSQSRGLLYIGMSSEKLIRRFTRYIPILCFMHKCAPLLMFLKDCRIYYLTIDKFHLKELEEILIKKYSPFFNSKGVNEDHECQKTDIFSDYLEFINTLEDYECFSIYEAELVLSGLFQYWPDRVRYHEEAKQRVIELI